MRRSNVDIDETKAYASEYTMNALCGGDRFNTFHGLGSVGNYLVQMAAQGANENALLISKTSTRTADSYHEMQKRLVQEYVSSIVGFGETRRTAIEAAAHLVQGVWDQYIEWARAGRIAEVGEIVGADMDTLGGRDVALRTIIGG